MIRVATKLLHGARSIEHREASELELSLALAARHARKQSIAALLRAGSGDPSGAFSAAELMACLYGAELNIWPSTVADPDRDRLVLSQEDAVPALCAMGAHFKYCTPGEAFERCKTAELRRGCAYATAWPWADIVAGAPGQGLGMAMGLAIGFKLQRRPSRVYAFLGEHELEAGAVWEAAIGAVRHRLDNLCAIINLSRYKNDDPDGWRLGSVAAKWRAFDWAVAEIDGHDIPQILTAFRRAGTVHDRPVLIVAHTLNGKGVSAFEQAQPEGARAALTLRQAAEALAELGTPHREITEILNGHGG